jgi:PAS domain S-box-containing protein
VVVSDIATDPRWEGYREHPLTYGLRACWSQPILGSQGEVLGTFAAYYEDVRTPSPDEIEIVEGAASLAGIAIERTRAAAALQESELRFRTLVEGIEEVFVIIDADGNIRYTSPASQRVTGFTSNERIGKLALDIIHPDDLALVHAKYLELVATPGAVIQLEAHIQHKDGSRRRISLLGKNLLHDPHLRGLVITYQDITEQRQLEEQLREAQRLEAVGRLAGGVAHDFNNLLNVIGGIVHLILLTRPEEGALQEDLQEILAAVRQATSLTQQLLAFSRRQMLQPQVLDIDRELDETSRMLRRVIGTDIALTTSLHSQGHTRADPGQINQVLMNLAVNARDAMPQGGTLTIETRATEITAAEVRCLPYPLPAGPYIEISMRDTGHGMDEKTLAHIFEPFFTTKGPGKGTGLGLPTVYGIVKQSDGFLRAESTPGQGSTFQIYLPHVPAQAKPDPTTRTTPPAAQGETILVVEDEPAMRMVTRRILEGSGYHVIEAPGGEEALRIVAEHTGKIDLVLTDIIMPGLSGAALAEHLLRQHPTLRILYMSGYTDDQVIRHGLRQEKTHFLQKPFEAEQLTRRVREVLGG